MIHENISIGLVGQLEAKVKHILLYTVGLLRDYLGITYWRIVWITINGLSKTEQSNLDLIVQFDSPDSDESASKVLLSKYWEFFYEFHDFEATL